MIDKKINIARKIVIAKKIVIEGCSSEIYTQRNRANTLFSLFLDLMNKIFVK